MCGVAATGNLSRELSLGGALLAAVGASSCCLGPIPLAAFGLGGAGVSSLGRFRPILLAVTVVALGLGFYLTYGKTPATADACGCDKEQSVTVFYQAGSNRPATYVKAIEDVGWEPSLVEVKK